MKDERLQNAETKFNFPPVNPACHSPSKQEIDAFRMKAFTLLKNHEIRFSSLLEQLKIIREVPIYIIEEKPAFSKVLEDSIIAMHQTISTLPGETIKVKGSFKRDSQAQRHSIPMPESFHVDSCSIQTGFPHPSQHHGWALHAELISKEHPLHVCMNDLAADLMPNGKYNTKAKELLKLKTAVFNTHAREFLELHCRLIFLFKKNENKSIEDFYEDLKSTPNPYAALSSRGMLEIKADEKVLVKAAEMQLNQFIHELEQGQLDASWMYNRLKTLLLNDIEYWEKQDLDSMSRQIS
jgi:hypothetical protein